MIIGLTPLNFWVSLHAGYIFTEHKLIYHHHMKHPSLGYFYQGLVIIYRF